MEQQGEGLLHDARNLMGTIGLYCDLLQMPGVLKPEHRQYPEELRMLGARSSAMIERLMHSVLAHEGPRRSSTGIDAGRHPPLEPKVNQPAGDSGSVKPVNLRSVVERCSGLLSRVANGKAIKVKYGVAATVPVKITEEAFERILVNLVRNAAAALGERTVTGDPADGDGHSAIRISVGLPVGRVGESKPWPFQRVRLVVEDSGCGMTQQQLKGLLCDSGKPVRASHGIGFRVVRELVAASNGELRVMSGRGSGTRVQIDWPVAAIAASRADVMADGDLRDVASLPNMLLNAIESMTRSRRDQDFLVDGQLETTC